ncbi:MAG TPA: DUF1634 domain-containing protein [Gemmatimonadaceae bacterium]|jgi:uncharacterized membrane protein|nr:DUF1634 domain-containing protein [Gemmatimonadaceae bacterium]
MTETSSRISEHEIEQVIGRLLQFGVLLAAAVTLVGGVMLLLHHGSTAVSYSTFQGEPAYLRSLRAIVTAAFAGDAMAVVQLGLLLLIATPVARVAFTLVAFALQRDRLYVLVTTIVLALLLYGLVFGGA